MRRRAMLRGLPALLAGCTQVRKIQDVAFHRTGSNVRRIALLAPAVPVAPLLFSYANIPGIEMIEGLVDAASDPGQMPRMRAFDTVLQQRGFFISAELVRRVMPQVRAAGFALSDLPMARPKAELLDHYPDKVPDVDALLDLAVLAWGYISGAATAPYHPILLLRYRMVAAGDHATLMRGAFNYSPAIRDVQPDPRYDYPDARALLERPERAITALSEGLDLAAAQIGRELREP